MRKCVAILLIVCMLFSLAACAGEAEGTTIPGSGTTTSGTEENEIVVTDAAGREVRLEEPAQRIVSAYYLSTSLLVMLGCTDRLVGVEMKADTRPLYTMAAPQLLSLPGVGNKKTLNVETVASLNPDLVVLPASLASYAEQLQTLRITVYVAEPESQEALYDTVSDLGLLTGTGERAEEYCDACRTMVDDAIALIPAAGADVPSVYIAGSSLYRCAVAGMYQDNLIRLAGAQNAAPFEGTTYREINAEDLLSMNPDYIFAVSYTEENVQEELSASLFASLSAVQNGRVYVFPSSAIEAWDYPAASSVLGQLWLISVLHPDVYPDDAFAQQAKEFYQTWFGISVTDSMLEG